MQQFNNTSIHQWNRETISDWFRALQNNICQQLEKADGGRFREDEWERPGGGGGRSRVMEGKHIEKGGVNFSAVHGTLSEKMQQSLQIESKAFLRLACLLYCILSIRLYRLFT